MSNEVHAQRAAPGGVRDGGPERASADVGAGRLVQRSIVDGSMSFADGARTLEPRGRPRDNKSEPARTPVQREADSSEGEGPGGMSRDPEASPDAGVVEAAVSARGSLRRLELDFNAGVHSHAQWLSRNWTRFLGRTNGNPSLAFAEADFMALASGPETLSTAQATTSVIVKQAKQKAIAVAKKAVGGAITRRVAGESLEVLLASSAAGTLLGALPILGGLVWSIVDKLLSAKAAEQERHTQGQALAEAIIERTDLFNGQAVETIGRSQLVFNSANAALDTVKTADELAFITSWIEGEQARLPVARQEKETSLADTLLANWVLQHSESPGEASSDVGDVAFVDASNDKNIQLPVRAGQRLLFIHQLKRGLLESGVVDHAQVGAIERRATAVLERGGIAGVIAEANGLQVIVTRPSDIEVLASKIDGSDEVFLAENTIGATDALGAIRSGDVRTRVTMMVEEEDDCAVLGALDFHATCEGRSREAFESGRCSDKSPSGGFRDARWSFRP